MSYSNYDINQLITDNRHYELAMAINQMARAQGSAANTQIAHILDMVQEQGQAQYAEQLATLQVRLQEQEQAATSPLVETLLVIGFVLFVVVFSLYILSGIGVF